MKTIARYTRCREWIFFAAALLCTVTQVKLELLFPEYVKNITVIMGGTVIDSGSLVSSCWHMLAFVAGSLLCALFSVLLVAIASSSITARIRQALFNKIMDFSLEEVAKFTTPSLITRCTFDVMQVQLFLSSAPPMLTRTMFMGVMATIGILTKNIVWTSITGGTVALMLLFIICIIVLLIPASMRVNKLADKLNKISLEHLTGLRVIHAYNAQNYQQKKFDSANSSFADTNIYINNRMALIYPSLNLFYYVDCLLIYASGVFILRAAGGSQKLGVFSDMKPRHHMLGRLFSRSPCWYTC